MIDNTGKKTMGKVATLADRLVEARNASVPDFGAIEHRLELVDVIDGVEYINDSKATDVGAAEYSLEYVQKPLLWIVSESEFDEDYEALKKLVTYKIIGVIAYGRDTSKIGQALSNCADYYLDSHSLEDALKTANALARKGQVVLFSPAAPGYPDFENFKQRGEAFRELVRGLHHREGRYEPSRQ